MRSTQQRARTRRAQRPVDEPPTLFELDLPKPSAGTYFTTVYRLDRIPSTMEGLHDALDYRYVHDRNFSVEERSVAGAPALLVHGTVARDRADWCDVLATLTQQDMTLSYTSGGGTLLVAVDDEVYALTYGTLGRWTLDHELLDPNFGINFAVRALAPDEIKKVRRRVVGATGRIDQNLVPGGQHIRLYGIDKWGEIVGQVCGRTDNQNLTACRQTGRPTRVEGSNSLCIHLCVEPEGLLADLREIKRVCQRQSPLVDLEFITQIRPVPANDPRLPKLSGRLDELLGLIEPTDVGLAVPSDAIADIELARSYRVRVPRSRHRPTRPSELTLADILTFTRKVMPGERWTALSNGRITMCSDEDGQHEIRSINASRWITAQLAYGSNQLLLHEDRWYEIGEKHRELLYKEIDKILVQPASVTLPPWPTSLTEEKHYNKLAADTDDRLVLLDRRLLRTSQHHRGIEACDLLGPSGELIHVKRAGGSSPLSHLFAQGVVAVDALKYEEDARAALIDRVRTQRPDYPIDLDFQPQKVIFAISLSGGRQLTAKTLFTFAQVALYRAIKTLANEGVTVEVVGIPPA